MKKSNQIKGIQMEANNPSIAAFRAMAYVRLLCFSVCFG